MGKFWCSLPSWSWSVAWTILFLVRLNATIIIRLKDDFSHHGIPHVVPLSPTWTRNLDRNDDLRPGRCLHRFLWVGPVSYLSEMEPTPIRVCSGRNVPFLPLLVYVYEHHIRYLFQLQVEISRCPQCLTPSSDLNIAVRGIGHTGRKTSQSDSCAQSHTESLRCPCKWARRDDGEFVISYCCHWCDCCHVFTLGSFIFWTSYELHAWAIPKNPSRNFEPSASQVCATVHGWKCLKFANSEAPSRVQFIVSSCIL